MTPDQQRQIAMLRGRVNSMRQGGRDDAMIRAGLIAEGWPAGAVIEAMMAAPHHQECPRCHHTGGLDEDGEGRLKCRFCAWRAADEMTRPGEVIHDT
jgi:hypothetical protein